jgi:cadherin 5 type 2 (VE-cadherin)
MGQICPLVIKGLSVVLYVLCSIQVLSLSEPSVNVVPITVEDTFYSLQNLTPGASYQVQLFTEYDGKESIAYTSRNFTTSK